MLNGTCHACGAENAYKEFFWQRGQAFAPMIDDTYQCQNCNHIFRHFKGDVEEYHREKYRVKGEEGHNMYPMEERFQYIDTFLECAAPFLNKQQSLLEIGSGDGVFALRAKNLVKNVVCSDIDTKMAQKCQELGFETINESILDFKDVKHDVVIGMDVLEHVLDIKKFNEKIAEIVNEYLILQVPVNRTMVPPNPTFDGHSHYFCKDSITRLFEDNFEAVRIFYGDRGKFARGPEMLCVFGRKNG
jgi:hypothetical protein